jgi:hypothetical protein
MLGAVTGLKNRHSMRLERILDLFGKGFPDEAKRFATISVQVYSQDFLDILYAQFNGQIFQVHDQRASARRGYRSEIMRQEVSTLLGFPTLLHFVNPAQEVFKIGDLIHYSLFFAKYA